MRQTSSLEKLLDKAQENGAGKAVLVQDYRDLVLALDTSGTSTLTVKFQGSIQEDEPNWEGAQSADNQWDYVQIKDLEDGSSLAGDTGVAISASDDHRVFEANTNGLRWLNAIISGYTGGEATVALRAFND